ncbi:MFS transporter [bacterium]|nr:MAG: MFS transporter [bacterium]
MRLASKLPLLRILQYRDFRILWIGAFVSFTGGQISNLAQGYFVFQLTGDEAKLALVPFVWSMPVFLFGLVAGSFADRFDKRRVLILSQLLFGVNSLYMAAATYWHFIQYWQIIAIALINGLIACVEMPTRQSVVSRVVPIEDLSAAVPVNAMTFNVARIVGPGIGGMILNAVGVFGCYLVDGISYLALIGSLRSIRSNLSGLKRVETSIKDLVVEGALYAVRDIRLRTLWLFELATAMFGLSYAALMPAFATDVLARGDKTAAPSALTFAGISIGLGAFLGLLVVTQLANSRHKGRIIRVAMAMIAVGLLGLSVTRSPWLAYPLLAMAGAGGIVQLNTTNALFQTLAPERLHGRVLAMHIWALNGLSPFGVLMFGNIARATKGRLDLPVVGGVPFAFALGGTLMAVVLFISFFTRKGLRSLYRELDESQAPAGASLR